MVHRNDDQSRGVEVDCRVHRYPQPNAPMPETIQVYTSLRVHRKKGCSAARTKWCPRGDSALKLVSAG